MCFPVRLSENGASGNKNSGSGIFYELCSYGINTAVNLQLAGKASFVDLLSKLGYLRQLIVHKALPTEARFYRHDQSHIESIYKRVQYARRRPRLERKADLFPVFLNDINSVRYVLIRVCLDMEHDKIGAGTKKPPKNIVGKTLKTMGEVVDAVSSSIGL